MERCECPARFSGNDEAEYRAHGCPSCVCYEEGDEIHHMTPVKFEEVMKRVEDDRKQRQQDQMDAHMVAISAPKRL